MPCTRDNGERAPHRRRVCGWLIITEARYEDIDGFKRKMTTHLYMNDLDLSARGEAREELHHALPKGICTKTPGAERHDGLQAMSDTNGGEIQAIKGEHRGKDANG